MIGCFPTLYPGEALYSGAARYCDRMGFPTMRAAVDDLYGPGSAAAVVDLPCYLGHLAGNLPPENCYTVDYLIDNHTLLPLYAPFLPTGRVAQLRAGMSASGGSSIHMRAGIMASSIPASSTLRFCPACVTDDRQQYGESYWHLVHQVPGVLLCPKHGALVQDSTVSLVKRRTRYEFISAERAVMALEGQEDQAQITLSEGGSILPGKAENETG